MKEYKRKPRLSKKTIRKLMDGKTVMRGIYEYSVDKAWNKKRMRFDEALLRWNDTIEEYEYWILGPKGLYEFEVSKK